MTAYDFVTLDVFTAEKFTGNQLAVLLDARELGVQVEAAHCRLRHTARLAAGGRPRPLRRSRIPVLLVRPGVSIRRRPRDGL